MAVHIGEAIESIRELRGMPKTTLAARMGRSAKNLHELLKNPSWDTQLLTQVSRALDYNFFSILAKDFEGSSANPDPYTHVSEPIHPYTVMHTGKDKSKGLDITIHVDSSDPESTERLLRLLRSVDK